MINRAVRLKGLLKGCVAAMGPPRQGRRQVSCGQSAPPARAKRVHCPDGEWCASKAALGAGLQGPGRSRRQHRGPGSGGRGAPQRARDVAGSSANRQGSNGARNSPGPAGFLLVLGAPHAHNLTSHLIFRKTLKPKTFTRCVLRCKCG